MTKLSKFVQPMNLHLFDGAASGGDGTAGSASSESTATSGTTNADNAQSAQGENNNGQVANASTSENVITTRSEERRVGKEC